MIATAEYYRDKITAAGFAFHPLRPNLTPADKDLLRRTMDERHGAEYLVRTVMMPALRDTYADLHAVARDADLVVGTDLLYAAPLVAEVLGIPWVAVTMAPLSFFSRHDPPMLMAAPWLERLAQLSKPLYGLILRLAQRATRDWGGPVFQLRVELGLERGPEPLFAARRNAAAILGMFSPIVGPPQPDWPANAHATGFAFYDHHEPMPRALAEFFDAGNPPIVFTLGSAAVFDPGMFYRESVEAARRLGRRAVLLVGPAPTEVPAPSDTIAIASYAPYSELFPRAAAIVHQGGIGTTAQALRAGRPMLIVPFSHDQPDNAARMVRLGVARTVRRRKYSAATSAAALATLLTDASFAKRAAQVAAAVKHENGAVKAADIIETVVRTGTQEERREGRRI